MHQIAFHIELVWFCPICNGRNCHTPDVAELSAEEIAEVEERTGMKYQPGLWQRAPSFVTCCDCGEICEVGDNNEQA